MFKSAVASEILCYLMEHPDAQDTKEGIVEWWLLHHRLESIENALNELVDRRFLERFKGPDAKIHSRIAAAKREQIRQLGDC